MNAQMMDAQSGDMRILVVDDEPQVRDLWQSILERADEHYQVEVAQDGHEAIARLQKSSYDLVITDIYMGTGINGYQLLEHIKQHYDYTAVLLMTNRPDHEGVVSAIRNGAAGYLLKSDFDARKGVAKVREVGAEIQSRRNIARLGELGIDTMLFRSKNAKMQNLLQRLPNFARSPETLLLIGESGVGKSSFAEAIHKFSARDEGPIVKVNCGAIAEDLLASELFGVAKGAFTGATTAKKGYFETASTGTLFLDELNSTSLKIQTALLGVLSTSSIIRVGTAKEIPIDVRVICATNSDLKQEIAASRFRLDLYYRISTFTLEIPALKDRPEDIRDLAHYFLSRQHKTREDLPAVDFSDEFMEMLHAYHWPGNIRELESTIKYSAQLCQQSTIQPAHLHPDLRAHFDERYVAVPEPEPIPPPTPFPDDDDDPGSVMDYDTVHPGWPAANARQVRADKRLEGGLPPEPVRDLPFDNEPEAPEEPQAIPAIWPEGFSLEQLVDTQLSYAEAMEYAIPIIRRAYLQAVKASFDTQTAAAKHAGVHRANFRRLVRTFVEGDR
ncbi:MAG: sigma-54-dependent transcriptional regulator [Bradymonadia bacterium]